MSIGIEMEEPNEDDHYLKEKCFGCLTKESIKMRLYWYAIN